MLLCAQYVLPVSSEAINSGAVLVRGNQIVDVGHASVMRRLYPQEEVRDLGEVALIPGLISAHVRLEDTMMHGMISDVPYMAWVKETHRLGEKAMADDWYVSAVAGGIECLERGITTVADTTSTGAAFKAIQDVGLRGVVFRDVAAMDKSRIERAMRAAEEDISEWRESAVGDRVGVGIAPASMYACHPEVFTRTAQFASRENIPLSIHMAGSREVYNFVKFGSSPFNVHGMDGSRGYVETPPWLPTGVTPVQYARNWGAFEAPRVIARHCVYVDETDIAILKEKNVGVVVCPRFNAQLGMGVPPFQEFARQGLPYAFGNDSPAATESIDLLVEARLALLMSRSLDTRNFASCADMLYRATLGAAEVLGMQDAIGSLDMGKRADIVALDLHRIDYFNAIDPESYIVNNCTGSDVVMTMVDGKILYERGEEFMEGKFVRTVARVIDIRAKLQK